MEKLNYACVKAADFVIETAAAVWYNSVAQFHSGNRVHKKEGRL